MTHAQLTENLGTPKIWWETLHHKSSWQNVPIANTHLQHQISSLTMLCSRTVYLQEEGQKLLMEGLGRTH